MARQWIEEEFGTLDLGDKRLNQRAKIITEDFVSMSESPPDGCQKTSALEACYRFCNNSKVQPDEIYRAHLDASIKRILKCNTVVTIQDSSEIDLTKPKRQVKGAGPLESNDQYGFFVHPLYAVDPEGTPLGMLDKITWVREPIRDDLSRKERAALRRQACHEEKESYRWIKMFQSNEQIARANPLTHFIHVADSESDIYELLLEINDQADNHDFILRACQNRSINSQNKQITTLDGLLSRVEILAEREVNVSERTSLIANETRPRRKSCDHRMAKVSIRATVVELRGPERPGGRLPSVTVNVIEAVELTPPEGEDAIRWVLLTSLPIETLEQIEQVIQYYGLRWQIEVFFKTLKSGMRIEKLKYQTIDRYLTAAALLMIVA